MSNFPNTPASVAPPGRIRTPIINREICSPPSKSSAARTLFLEKHEAVSLTINATDENAIPLFEQMPEDLLPTLPIGHQWGVENDGGKPAILKSIDAPEHELDIILYGPDKNKINYIFQVDGVTWQSFSHTRAGKSPPRKFPMTARHYTVKDFEYDDAKSHIRGHCIDHQDTMLVGPQKFYSTFDCRNYIPEPHYKYWGLTMRRLITAEIRKNNNAYMQFVHYPQTPYITIDKTPVPDYGYLYEVEVDKDKPYTERYSLEKVYNFDWDTHYAVKKGTGKVLDFAQNYKTSTESAPTVKIYDVSASDRDLRLQIRNMNKKYLSIMEGNIFSFDPKRDAFFIKNNCADKEFESINRKIEASLHAKKVKEDNVSKKYAKMAGG